MEDSFFFRKAAELRTAFEKEGIPFQNNILNGGPQKAISEEDEDMLSP
jgi:hypothetical protein